MKELEGKTIVKVYIDKDYENPHIFFKDKGKMNMIEIYNNPDYFDYAVSIILEDKKCHRCHKTANMYIYRHFGWNDNRLTCINCCEILDKEK